MYFSISDNMISEFASGLFAVFALIGVGSLLMLVLSALAQNFPFTRVALTLALTPLSLIKFLDNSADSTVYLYAMITLLLGITIDGINHILTPKAAIQAREPKEKKAPAEQETAPDEEADPGMIVWEKAE